MSLKTDYKDYIPESTYRKWEQIDNGDDTISLVDVTDYAQVGDKFKASDINATNTEIVKSNLSWSGTITTGSWTLDSSGLYVATMTCSGMTSAHDVVFNVQNASLISASSADYQDARALIVAGATSANTLTLYATEVPSVDLPLIVSAVRWSS